MTVPAGARNIRIEIDGRVVAAADVSGTDDPAVVRSAMHLESGQLPPGARSMLVDAVLDAAEVQRAGHLSASMPAGETEMVDRVRQRSASVELRRTGATKQVEADLPVAQRETGRGGDR